LLGRKSATVHYSRRSLQKNELTPISDVAIAGSAALELVVKLAVLVFAAWAFWVALRPRRAFVVRVDGGVPRPVKGTVTAAFLDQVRQVCAEQGASSGTVSGLVRGRRISLAFSGGIPPAARQRLRNWWAISGWPGPPPAGRGPARRA
jgi:hypothetical protein